MRLQCPNCDAEYEVDSAAIPQEGRDVQCSNCGHGWFQPHPEFAPDPDMESALYDPPPPLAQARPNDARNDVRNDAPGPRREIDPAALQILREEAAREEALRARDSGAGGQAGAASGRAAGQGGDVPIAIPARAAMRRVNRVRLDGPAAPQPSPPAAAQAPSAADSPDAAPVAATPAAAAPAPGARPGPSVDAEIDPSALKSTLRQQIAAKLRGEEDDASTAPEAEDDLDDMQSGPRRRRRLGTWVGILLAGLLAGAYVMAPQLVALAPQLGPYIAIYVNIVDILRDLVQIGVVAVQDLFGQAVQAVMALL